MICKLKKNNIGYIIGLKFYREDKETEERQKQLAMESNLNAI